MRTEILVCKQFFGVVIILYFLQGDIEFQRVHRVGKINEDGTPRPILARFLRYSDREFVFSKAKSLKDTGYGLSADFLQEISRRRKLQMKKLSEARKNGRTAHFSRAQRDKLFIDGVLNQF